jgi:hypothetical protein
LFKHLGLQPVFGPCNAPHGAGIRDCERAHIVLASTESAARAAALWVNVCHTSLRTKKTRSLSCT